MKRILMIGFCLLVIICAIFALFGFEKENSDVISLSCSEHTVVANLSSGNSDFVIDGERVGLTRISDTLWENDNWAFVYDAENQEYLLLDKSGLDNIWVGCGMNNLTSKCENVLEEVNLNCSLGNDKYVVAAKICNDRAVLNINDEQYVLPVSRVFFENAEFAFLSGDGNVGFVVNPGDEPDFAAYGKYILKVNGNEYPSCTVVE